MATRIVHFGVDDRAVLAVLANSGYDVEDCGTSVRKLSDTLKMHQWDAVVIQEDGVALGGEILATARSFGSIPLILFRGEVRTYEPSHFDLVISPHIPSNYWLRRMEELIDQSRAVRVKSRLEQERSNSLLQESASLAQATSTLIAASRHSRAVRKQPRVERPPIKCILIVDDYAPWRQRVVSMLRDYAELQAVAQAADGLEAVRIARELKPDLILLDLHLPQLDGIEAARQICQVAPEARIIFVSMNTNADIVREALKTGADGYVLKIDAGTELWPAIETVHSRKSPYLSQGVQLNAGHDEQSSSV